MELVAALDAVARHRPTATALAWRNLSWTYTELKGAIATVEADLKRRQLPIGTRVALLVRNSPHYVAAYYGSLAAGCVAVPLNVQERASVLARHVADSEADLVIGDVEHAEWDKLRSELGDVATDFAGIRLRDGHDTLASLERELAATAAAVRRRGGADPSLASIIYTSGTTGRAKGVMLSHANLHANARSVIRSLELCERDHSLCVLPFHFSYGNSVLHSHLLCGARLTLEDNFAFPHLLLQRIQDERVTGFAGVPSTFALLLRHRLSDRDLSALRYVTQAGGPMPRPVLARLREQLPATHIYLMYGQTEATARLTCLPWRDLDRKPGSTGVPVDGVEIEIRDGGEPVPPGRSGEIWVRGPNVMLGYWKDPAATAEVLRDGWLWTRDLGYLDEEGYLFIAGRATDMIKTGAFRVSPQEIEEIIAGLEEVDEVGVIGIDDDVLGQAVKAVIVLRAGASLSEMTVKAHCRAALAAYKVPKIVEFAAALPRTSSGKVQRFKLAGAQSKS